MISKEQVKLVAKLSKLKFDREGLDYISGQLVNISKMTDQLAEVDCDGVEPLVVFEDVEMKVREDVVEQRLSVDDLFRNSPSKLKNSVNCFVVPKAVE